ncbi:MAG: hypothetical protein ABII27_02140 [bacterium]
MELNEFIKLVEFKVEYREGEFPYLLTCVICNIVDCEVRLHFSSLWLKSKGKWIIKSDEDIKQYSQDTHLRDFIENFVSILYMQKKLVFGEDRNDFEVGSYFSSDNKITLQEVAEILQLSLKEDRNFDKIYA